VLHTRRSQQQSKLSPEKVLQQKADGLWQQLELVRFKAKSATAQLHQCRTKVSH
jgi:hypothetical protein